MKGNSNGIIAIVAILVVAALIVPINEMGTIANNLGLGTTVSPGDASVDPNDCPETTPSLDPNAYDIANGTALTETTNIYRIVGDKAWSTFTQGTAFVLPVGVEIEYVFGISTTDTIDNAYGPYARTTIGCQEDVTGWASDGSNAQGLYEDEVEASMVGTFYTVDDNTGAQTMTAGKSYIVEFKWSAGNNEYFGNPYIPTSGIPGGGDSVHRAAYPNTLCMDLNATTFDSPDWVKVKGGAIMNKVNTPTRHSSSSGKTAYCYEAPVITDQEMRFEISLNTDDSTAPGVDDTAYLYGANFYVEAEDDEFDLFWGIEDQNGNAEGQDAADSITIDVTA